ncbi:hypothetical protein EDD98_7593 [Streptomyces sp. PanSC19]|uniref:hypothetical protein n=1 Tax=Streptomyces sp. PanSC19 TaxID=1520455 RepID=UPI000F99CDE8|nr:hypothetical protein [Streptomyces sp. PanSC19]ROQ23144.1 hypothetical protein EDD98_7593 [Streptomyces sp. PanSC19]
MSGVPEEGIAAGVGSGLDRRGRFGPVAAWAWMWRNFDTVLPDVTGAAWQADAAAPSARAVEAEGYARYAAHGPW